MKKNIIAFVVFILLSIIMTYPTVFKMKNHIPGDMGDPLLVVWTLSWDIHKICTGLKGYWDANIFYPHNNTLAYSDHLTGLAILGLPIKLITRNIILTYNFLYLLAFILSGFSSYMLIKYLTKNFWAGIIGGIIFAFCMYKFSHRSHLHLISTYWIAWGFLCLHKFFERLQYKYIFLFILFFVLQWLSSIHYALFMSLYSLFFFFYYVISEKIRDIKVFVKITAIFILGLILVLPFLYPYISLNKYSNFKRSNFEIKYNSAHIESYLAAYEKNWLYGKLTRKLRFHHGKGSVERELFVGAIALFLAILSFWPIKTKPLNQNIAFYFTVAVSAALFSYGPVIQYFNHSFLPGPYLILYHLIPGFKSLRFVSRFAVMVFFGISVMAGYGYKNIILKINSPIIKFITGKLLIFLLLAESISIPLHTFEVKVGNNIPSVYKWLSSQKSDFPIIELPFHPLRLHQDYKECLYMYYSTYHWKNIFNGYSGFYSPSYIFLTEYFDVPSSPEFIDSLKLLGIKYLIIHSQKYEISKWQDIYQELEIHKENISFVKRFDSDFVYEIKNSSFNLIKPEEPGPGNTIPKKNWHAESNVNIDNTHKAFDNDLKTRWDTAGPRQPGSYFQLDLGNIYKFDRILLSLGNTYLDYPDFFSLEVSEDGINWKETLHKGNIPLESFLSYLFYLPENVKIDITFEPQKARYIRLTQMGKHDMYWWTIYEIDIQRFF